MNIVNFRCDDELLTKIDEASAKHNISRSAFLKMAVTDYISSMAILEKKWPEMQKTIDDLQDQISRLSSSTPFDFLCNQISEEGGGPT